MSTPRIPIPRDAVAPFCRRWKITEFAFFGSVVRDDFGPDSDVDVLEVDLVTRKSVERSTSEWRRNAVLNSLSHVALAS